jgi:hypothetical protein
MVSEMSTVRQATADFRKYAADYARDGAVVVRGALGERELALVERAFEQVLNDRRTATDRLDDENASGLSIAGYSVEDPAFRDVMEHTALADIASGVFGGGPVWYVGNQLLLKRGGKNQRTYWHQDSAYEPYGGAKNAVLWVTLESLAAANALEVVRGTHTGATYNVLYAADRAGGKSGAYDESVWNAPVIPDIDAERDKWDIFSTATNRGDVLVFHENSIHGGAPTFPGQTRRTLSFRMAGDDVVYTPRPPMKDRSVEEMSKRLQGARFHQAFEGLEPGEPISHGLNLRQVRS